MVNRVRALNMGQQVSLIQMALCALLVVLAVANAISWGEPLAWALVGIPIVGLIWSWGFWCAWSGS